MNIALISQLVRGLWAIDPTFAQSQIPLINNLLSGVVAIESNEKNTSTHKLDTAGKMNATETARYIAMISIQGTLTKSENYCTVSMKNVTTLIKNAENDPDAIGIILNIDSPGGTVDGTFELGELIRNCSKPIVAYTDGMIASAAYWLASQTKYIVANNRTCEIGSIGVMLSVTDYEPKMRNEGVQFHTIYATQSSDKNANITAIKEGKYDTYRTEVLDPLAQEFIDNVRSGRPSIQGETLTGKMYFADKALANGMIDVIGSLQVAAEKILELSQNPISKNTSMKKFAKLMVVLGVSALEATAEGTYLSAEQLKAIEGALPSNDADNDNDNSNSLDDENPSPEGFNLIAQITALENRIKKIEESAAEDSNTQYPNPDFGIDAKKNEWAYADNK